MIINDAIIKKAIEAIKKGEKEFSLNSLKLLVSKEMDYRHIVGQMPSYFEFEGEKYVAYSKVKTEE